MKPDLCFGLMRLPLKGEEVDLQTVCALVDRFLENGFSWFDTARPYHGGNSELIFRQAVAERHERKTFQLADKFSQNMLPENETPMQFFKQQLERTGLEYFDRYMLHAMDAAKIAEADEKGYWDFLSAVKREGRALSVGFSLAGVVGKRLSVLAPRRTIRKLNRLLGIKDKDCRIINMPVRDTMYSIDPQMLVDDLRDEGKKLCGENFTFADIYNEFYERGKK